MLFAVTAFLGLALVATGTAGPIAVDLVPATDAIRADAPVSAKLVAEPANGEGEAAIAVRVPGSTSLELMNGRGYQLRLEGEAWGPPVDVPSERRGSAPYSMVVSRVGWLAGRLRNGTGRSIEDWPSSVRARFDLRSNPVLRKVERDEWRFETDCPVTEGAPGVHRFRCRLPEGVSDVRLTVDGFIPRYLWSVEVPPGEEVEEPVDFALEIGASLVGVVERPDGTPAGGATVVAAPPVVGGVARGMMARELEALEMRGTAGERGFFQLKGLAPGRWALRVSLRDVGVVEVPGVEVDAGVETALPNPVVLEEFPEALVVVDPPVPPAGGGWSLVLVGADGSGRASDADPSGTATFELLPAGEYELLVSDEDGQRWLDDQIELSRASPRAEVRIGVVPVIGTVTVGDEPLEADLYFGGRSGAESILVRSDEEGAFAGILPREGDWRLEVVSEEPKVHHAFRAFPVELDPGLGAAELAVELPGTTIAGRVVDDDGLPARGAQVIVQPTFADARIVQTATEDDGSFELAGQREGTYHVKALGPGGTESPIAIVDVEGDGSPPPVELVLTESRSFHGRVISASGQAVVGARLWAIRTVGSPEPSDFIIPTGFTDASGEFELRIPPDQPWSGVAVLAPGQLLGLFAIEASGSGSPETLRLRSTGGATLLLVRDEREETGGRPGRLVLDGQWEIDVGLLSRWAGQRLDPAPGNETDVQVRVSGLPPGAYSYCTEGAIPVCDSGFLPAGGDLELSIAR